MLHSRKRRFFYLPILLLFITLISCSSQPEPYVDDIEQARSLLEEERNQALSQLQEGMNTEALNKLTELGLWEEVQDYLDGAEKLNNELKLVQAQLLIKKHQYQKAEEWVAEVLGNNPKSYKAHLLRAELYMQAWELQKADSIAITLLDKNSSDAEAGLIRGNIALLKRNYDKALEWAEKVQGWNSEHAGGYLLEAESHFWAQNPAAAEPALIHALELDPFNPGARFSYGYAIWRRVDATQLDDMAAQWNLAFEVNPLHYLSHWHFGNGHTNLTYADYAHPTDSLVNARLEKADELISQDRLDEAIAITRKVGAEFPESVHPAMMRGSIYYMAYDMNRSARLDSAQAIFESILNRKQNYGPAHNGLAAVIKQRQFTYLSSFDSLKQVIQETEIPDEGNVFYEVFKDAAYYPGDRVKKMIAQQIGPSKAYLPLINMFGSDFAIPPLHKDLAEAMGRSYFRYGTTFDNRQWMDIRGVGSGATGIEYLERGAHLERNVLAHEYAHLYHGRILTDKESRRIRALYHTAMKNNRTLDYYASNNESEFFAQGYAGFLSPQKVHPLNHKSMNTREYIKKKDPAFYAFLDSLLQKQKRYLSGDEEVFDDNWAQAYLSLAERSDDNFEQATARLDKALNYSPDYIPALLEYAEVHAESGNFEAAGEMIARAEKLDQDYAPIYASKAKLIHEKALQGELSFDEAIKLQSPLFEKAYELEDDLAVRARFNRTYRERYKNYGQIAEAAKVAEDYLKDAPTISTYLRDRKDQAEAYAKYLRSSLGYAKETIGFFQELTDRKPQNFEFRLMFADVLMQANQLDEALEELKESREILAAANNERADFALRIAQIHIDNEDISKAEEIIASMADNELNTGEQLMLAKIYAQLGSVEKGNEVLAGQPAPELPIEKAQLNFVQAKLAEAGGKMDQAAEKYQATLASNPYHLKARAALIKLLKARGNSEKADQLTSEAAGLAIPLGPNFTRIVDV